MKPLIGITCHNDLDYQYMLSHAYVQAVIEAGGIPLLLAMGVRNEVSLLTKKLDGLLLSGGYDINPLKYGEEPHKELGEVSPGRDDHEFELVQEFLRVDKPILGICRGHQVLNVIQGGTMYQDIHTEHDTAILQHIQRSRRDHTSHNVHLVKDSKLSKIMDSNSILVNSLHHQAVKEVGSSLIVTGTASDGIIEAIESEEHSFVIGVQWHPETTACAGDVYSKKIFEAFINASN